MLNKMEFCRRAVVLGREPISFAGRPYLEAIYDVTGRNLVLRCSRQTEKSTFLANSIQYEACQHPGIQLLFVCPRQEQARVFSKLRLHKTIANSPLIRRVLQPHSSRRAAVMNMEFDNGSTLFVRSAFHSGDSCRGLSADLLLVDEFQDIAEGDLPVLQETLSHAQNPRTILTGTPKHVDNHLESIYRQSTAHEWTVRCPACARDVILDERSLGPAGLECPGCTGSIDPQQGRWVSRNPTACWGEGFWIGHPMVPWLDYGQILDRQRTYDIGKFKNEVLGLPTTTGDHVVSRAELEACCSNRTMAATLADVPRQHRDLLVAGIDWGGGGRSRTVLVIGSLRENRVFEIWRMERLQSSEDTDYVLDVIAQRLRDFRIQTIAADGGGAGHHLNRQLLNRLGQEWMYAILYGATSHEPRREGTLVKWMVDRSATIGLVFTRVKHRQIDFPRLAESGVFLDDFACEIAEYDDEMRSIRYTHPESQTDDALHATNYAALAAWKLWQSRAPLHE
jgi:hypothetical protein